MNGGTQSPLDARVEGVETALVTLADALNQFAIAFESWTFHNAPSISYDLRILREKIAKVLPE